MLYSSEHLLFLSENRTTPRAELTQKFNEFFGTEQTRKAICAICKRKGFNTGRDGRFSSGNPPFNKGTKGLTGANKTSFKKGQVPKNKRPIGSSRLTKAGYLIKIAEPNKWAAKHRIEWEKVHGKIPAKMLLCFLDGNPLNTDLSNLKLISRRENALFNKRGFTAFSGDLQPTLRNLTKLEAMAFTKGGRERKTALGE